MSDTDVPRIIILLNKELGMKPGKMVAQACHAMHSLARFTAIREYSACITLYVKDKQAMFDLRDALPEAAKRGQVIVDEGRTEIPPGSVTALALLGRRKDLDPLTNGLELV